MNLAAVLPIRLVSDSRPLMQAMPAGIPSWVWLVAIVLAVLIVLEFIYALTIGRRTPRQAPHLHAPAGPDHAAPPVFSSSGLVKDAARVTETSVDGHPAAGAAPTAGETERVPDETRPYPTEESPLPSPAVAERVDGVQLDLAEVEPQGVDLASGEGVEESRPGMTGEPGSLPGLDASGPTVYEAGAPQAAAEPPVGTVDDLKIVEGIGPKMEALLCAAGITTFAQLSTTEVERLRKIVRDAGYAMTDPGTWPEQARLAAENDWDGLKALQARFKAGRRIRE